MWTRTDSRQWNISLVHQDIMKRAVAAGIQKMDADVPHWKARLREKLETEQLAMNNCEKCVGGHLFGDYEKLLAVLFPELRPTGRCDLGAAVGLAVPFTIRSWDCVDEDWDYLGSLWIDAIQEE